MPKRSVNILSRPGRRPATATTSVSSTAEYAAKWPWGLRKVLGGCSSSRRPPMRPAPMMAAR